MVFDRMFDRYLPTLNLVRESFALPRLESLADVYHQADLRLIQTSKAFDACIDPAPANVRYVGPILDDPVWADDALPHYAGPSHGKREFSGY